MKLQNFAMGFILAISPVSAAPLGEADPWKLPKPSPQTTQPKKDTFIPLIPMPLSQILKSDLDRIRSFCRNQVYANFPAATAREGEFITAFHDGRGSVYVYVPFRLSASGMLTKNVEYVVRKSAGRIALVNIVESDIEKTEYAKAVEGVGKAYDELKEERQRLRDQEEYERNKHLTESRIDSENKSHRAFMENRRRAEVEHGRANAGWWGR